MVKLGVDFRMDSRFPIVMKIGEHTMSFKKWAHAWKAYNVIRQAGYSPEKPEHKANIGVSAQEFATLINWRR